MNRLIYGADQLVCPWVAAHIATAEPRDFAGGVSIGVARDGELIAGIVYTCYYPEYGSICISVAATSPLWLTRGVIASLMAYPFRQLGCQRVTAMIGRRNRRSRAAVERLGFKLEGTVRRGFGPQDCMVYGLLREEAAKWLKEETHGIKSPITTRRT